MRHYTKDEIEKMLTTNIDAAQFITELREVYEAGDLDHSCGDTNFFNLIEDPKKVVIQHWNEELGQAEELIAASFEEAACIVVELEGVKSFS